MDILSGIILGVVQGLTEFLPVSSTGHLILAREALGLQVEYGLSVDAMLHLATALAVLIYFRSDFIRLLKTAYNWIQRKTTDTKDRTLVVALVLGTIPAVVVGLLLEDIVSTVFRSPLLVAGALVAGSVLFIVAEYVAKKKEEQKIAVSAGGGFAIGLFQALALIPGMSRSGMTIVGGLLLGLTREEAARFGFLLSLPIIIGAGSKSVLELGLSGIIAELGFSLLLSALAAFGTAIVAIHYLLKYLRTHTLMVFVIYRLVLAGVVLLFVF